MGKCKQCSLLKYCSLEKVKEQLCFIPKDEEARLELNRIIKASTTLVNFEVK